MNADLFDSRALARCWHAKVRPRRKASSPLWLAGLVILIATESLSVSPAHASRYEFDQRRSEVRFAYRMAFATQRGRFTRISGTLDYNQAAPGKSKVNASIATDSLSTGEAYIDDELKGTAFFNAAASPVIAFKSLTIKPRTATTADLLGEITINGITRPVMLKVSLAPHDDPALRYDTGSHKFHAKTRIKRSAFNMTKFLSLVDDEVDLEIDAIVRPR